MLDFIQMVVSGIAVGSSYSLMGLAMVIIYKTSEVPNFAQGEMALATSFFTLMLLEQYGLPYHMAFPAAFIFAVLLGCILEFAILRRAKEPNILGFIAITIGMEMVLMGLVSWKFGADPKTMPFPISPYDSIAVGGIFFSTLELLTLVVALFLMIVRFSVLQVFQTRYGHEGDPAEQHGSTSHGYPHQPHAHDDLGDLLSCGLYGRPAHIADDHATLHDVGPLAERVCRRGDGGHDIAARGGVRCLHTRHHRKPFRRLCVHRI